MTYKFDFFLDLYFLNHGVLGENRNPEEACLNFPINFYEFWFPLLISILVAHVVLLKMLLLFYLFRFFCDWKICLLIHISNVHLKATYVPHL